MPSSFQILDTTLREGEHRYGVFFPVAAKVALAAELAKIADFVEIVSPLVAPSFREAAEKIARVVPPEQLVVHCTLNEEFVRAAKDFTLSDSGARWRRPALLSGTCSACAANWDCVRGSLARTHPGRR